MAGMVLTTLLCSLALFGLSQSAGFEGCRIKYGRRGCYDKVHTGVLVSCDGNEELAEIPETIPADTVFISLVNFKFGQLSRANLTKLRTVECMVIMDSGITSIDYDTFADLENLHELELRNTDIENGDMRFMNHPEFKADLIAVTGAGKVEKLDFNGTNILNNLRVLSLDENGISSINPTIISKLTNLERLSLSRNNLHTMDWMSLTQLTHLNKLFLDGNMFQTIPEYVQTTFSAVHELTLAENPLHCNCKLKWLKEFYDTTSDKLLDYDAVECASPFSMRMIDTFVEDYKCGKPMQPVVDYIELEPFQYIVNCSSLGDPAPTLTLDLPEQRKLVTPPHEDISLLKTQSPRILTSGGQVTCTASNSEGSIVTVLEMPMPNRATSVSLALPVLLLFSAISLLSSSC